MSNYSIDDCQPSYDDFEKAFVKHCWSKKIFYSESSIKLTIHIIKNNHGIERTYYKCFLCKWFHVSGSVFAKNIPRGVI